MMKRSADKRSVRNPGARTSSPWTVPLAVARGDEVQAAADILNSGRRIAILAGLPATTRSTLRR